MNIKKISLFIVALVTLFACSNEDMVSSQYEDLQVNADFLRLSDNNNTTAGNLVIHAGVPEVAIKWNTGNLCNLDTTQTTLKLSKGTATLPIRWMEKLEAGTYGPEGVAFKAGVQITAGDKSQYIPLVWADKIDSTEILKSAIETRAAGDILPRVAQISMLPLTVNMNDVNGGSMYVGLTDVSFAIFDVSEITSDLNIDMTKIPNYITASQILDFKWTAAGAPIFSFSARIIAMAEGGIYQEGKITYTKSGPSLNYVGSNLPIGNIFSTGGTYTFTFEGTYTGNVQIRALANGAVIATGAGTVNKQPNVTIPKNTTGTDLSITFQYKREDGNWTNLPTTTNRTQESALGGIVCGGLTWAPGNLRLVNGVYTFMDNQGLYTGIKDYVWNSVNNPDYWAWNTQTLTTTSLNNGDPCTKVAPAGRWRMPTKSELNKLENVQRVNGTYYTPNAISGYYFETNNAPSRANQDSFLFLPIPGRREASSGNKICCVGLLAGYWSGTSDPSDNSQAFSLVIGTYFLPSVSVNTFPKNDGNTIRCVAN